MRLTLITAMLLLMTVSTAMGQAGKEEAAIQKALSSMATVNYVEAPWSEIEEDFETRYKFNIVLSHSAKDDALTKDEPMTIDLTGVSIRSILRHMLKEKNATYTIKDGVLLIISKDDEEDPQYMNRTMFDVTNLLKLIAKHEGELNIPVGKGKKAKPAEPKTASTVLADVVASSFGGVWKESGGSASFKIAGNQAVLFSPEVLKDSVGTFLKELEQRLAK